MRLIRPLVYAGEALTEGYARAFGLAPVGCVCGDKDGVRREIRGFLSALAARHPGVPESLSAALGNVNPRALFGAARPQTSPSVRAADTAAD